jgi:hypothetical protein
MVPPQQSQQPITTSVMLPAPLPTPLQQAMQQGGVMTAPGSGTQQYGMSPAMPVGYGYGAAPRGLMQPLAQPGTGLGNGLGMGIGMQQGVTYPQQQPINAAMYGVPRGVAVAPRDAAATAAFDPFGASMPVQTSHNPFA